MSESRDRVQHLLMELGLAYGCTFSLDDKGSCGIAGENGIRLILQVPAQDPHLYINAELGAIPAEDAESVYYQALTLNLFQGDTRGAAIAIDPLSKQLVLCYVLALESSDYRDYTNIITNLLTTAEALRQQLFEARPAAGEPIDLQADMLPVDMMLRV